MPNQTKTRVATEIALPPGPLAGPALTELLHLLLVQARWIAPDSWGEMRGAKPIPAASDPERLRFLARAFAEHGTLELSEGRERVTLSIVPNRYGQRTFTGYVYWTGPAAHSCLAVGAHRDTVVRAMGLLRSPLAFAAAREAIDAFRGRMVRDEHGLKMVASVGDYSRGLEHPHWRMWFGPEYVAFFGREVLARAPALLSQTLDDVHFVQLHERPEEWNQPAGRQAAARFAAALGKQTFYDPDDPGRGLAAPDFSHLMGAAR